MADRNYYTGIEFVVENARCDCIVDWIRQIACDDDDARKIPFYVKKVETRRRTLGVFARYHTVAHQTAVQRAWTSRVVARVLTSIQGGTGKYFKPDPDSAFRVIQDRGYPCIHRTIDTLSGHLFDQYPWILFALLVLTCLAINFGT